jgi:sugar phosphate isomerase/epimerase
MEVQIVKAGLATIALRELDVFQVIDLAGRAGFQGVEVWGRPPHTPYPFDEVYTASVRDRILQLGMEPSILGSYTNSASEAFQTEASLTLRIAKALGTKIIRVWAGDTEPCDATNDDWMRNAANLKWMSERADDVGITLAIEMHGGTLALTPEGVLRLLELANTDNLKLNFQVNDPAAPDLDRSVSLIGSHIVMVHAQNYVRAPEGSPHQWERSLVEEGLTDYRHLVALLRHYSFDGYVEVEFLKGEPDRDKMLDAMQKDALFLRRLVADEP